MPPIVNPALTAFVSQIDDELVVAQVWIRRRKAGFELRHSEDRSRPSGKLRTVRLRQLRSLAQFTAAGAFRPLKSAPNLQKGWKLMVRSVTELETAMRHLYPGGIADWYAAQSPKPPITHYREFTGRQTGMYRITQKLTDALAAEAIRACCRKSFCLKQRLWSVKGLEPDSLNKKSLIPCLEPCALLLEFARKAMRIEQEETRRVELAPSDLRTLVDALRRALAHPDPEIEEANMNSSLNGRRIQRLLERLESHQKSSGPTQSDSSEAGE